MKTLDQWIQKAASACNTQELALGFVRYETLRRLNPRQFADLCQRNLKGEKFDDMVDDLTVKGTDNDRPHWT